MHFAKTYTQLLVTLPPELRDNAFEYRKLKQLINQTTRELDSLGLAPSILRSLRKHEERDDSESVDPKNVSDVLQKHSIVYEFVLNSSASVPEPQLRLSSFDGGIHRSTTSPPAHPVYHADLFISDKLFDDIKRALLHSESPKVIEQEKCSLDASLDSNRSSDLIIPLPSDIAFFHLLTFTLASLSRHLDTLHDSFKLALTSLAGSISSTARPASHSAPSSFSAYSLTADNLTSLRPRPGGKSDLYTWREIFRIYTESEVFESVRELTQRERSIEEAEKNLNLFQGHIQGKKASLLLSGSQQAFDVFLNLNTFILDVKKFQFANSEASRKILKKHAKRTTFLVPIHILERTYTAFSRPLMSIPDPSRSLPRLLVQAVGEILLPVVPHIDNYTCLICTSIAFKPVRLFCGHFFCVRCLVKMQRRGMANCPMCRSSTVLQASPSNIDYGLLNFMTDWFPIESLEKLRANEQEVTEEQLAAFGITNDNICRVM